MSYTLKMSNVLKSSPSLWTFSTRLLGDKSPSTGIPCSNEECPKPCPEENPTCPKPCPKEASCPESSLKEKNCLTMAESVTEEEECKEEEEESDTEECSEPDEMDVPGLSKAVLCVPEGEVGPGASKCGDYKNPEYFSFHRKSYYEAEIEMSCYRNPQPSAKKKTEGPE